MIKNLTFFFVILLAGCSSSPISDKAAFEFDNAWYWVCTYSEEVIETERRSYAEGLSNPQQTALIFFYPDSVDVDYYGNTPFNLNKLRYNLLNNPRASHGYVKIPKQPLDTLGLLYIDY